MTDRPSNDKNQLQESLDYFDRYQKKRLEEDMSLGVTGYCPRLFHPKCSALLEATFQVNDNIPEEWRIGIFSQPGATFKAHLRYSAARNRPTLPDEKYDGRGVSIKLYNVNHETDPQKQQDHNFTFLNYPIFFLNDKNDAHDALRIGYERTFKNFLRLTLPKFPLPIPFRAYVYKIMYGIVMQKNGHMFNTQLYSATPYNLGKNFQVKYSLKPTIPTLPVPPERSTEFLRDQMEDYLKTNRMTYDFMLQFRKEGMPINDASIEWDEKISPYIPFAKIMIEPQQFNTPERYAFAETMAFPLDEVLAGHEPIGSLNELRTLIYKRSIAYRRQFKKDLNAQ